MPQMSRQLELPLEPRGETPKARRSVEASTAPAEPGDSGERNIMERALNRPNMFAALKRVRKNKGGPGIDGMTVDELPEWLKQHWPRVREELLAGTYQPLPVRRHAIPKPGGGERELGIPTVLDRLIQQALLQVLQPLFDPGFSDHSYGFRPGRRAHDAVRRAKRYVQEGRNWVVDVDLERFFDRVNHDVLMGKLASRIADKTALRLIRRYLQSGMMSNGVARERRKGTPQGGPLSPLLANVLLDEVDKELEKRGHAFVRYADDSNVYVRSKRAGERAMALMRRLFSKLRLQVNETKSAVAPVGDRQFLGFALWRTPKGEVRIRIASKSLGVMKRRVRQLTRPTRGRSLAQVVADLRPYLLGWRAYYGLTERWSGFTRLNQWIRHRLRAYQLKQWRRPRTIFRELVARGARRATAAQVAANAGRWWRNSAMALNYVLPNRLFADLGLPELGR